MTDGARTCRLLLSLPYIFASRKWGIVASLVILKKRRRKGEQDWDKYLVTLNWSFQVKIIT